MNEKRTLFHCAPILVGEGSTILPGNWGRVIRVHSYRHHQYQRETIFEKVRREVAPDAPPRLKSIFALRTLREAISYINIEDAKGSLVYECEQVDIDAKTWIAPLNVFSMRTSEVVMAEHYWQHAVPLAESDRAPKEFMGMGATSFEVVTMSPLKVIRGPFTPWVEVRPHNVDEPAL